MSFFTSVTSRLWLLAFCLVAPLSANASEAADSGDTAWIMTSTALVLFMTLPGLALFYGGLVRVRNVLSVLMQCFAIACVASLLWVVVGYSLAFSDGGEFNRWIGGSSNFFLRNVTRDSLSGAIPESVFVMFQMTFAVITPALIIGAFAERMRFSAVLLFSAGWLMLVYFPVCHWVWGGGWLADLGVLDFAGGTVVHITAGVSALVAALMIGRRKGFPERPMPPHNLTMTVTGAGMLWIGWFGFNGGSALAANGDAGMAILVTHVSAATGALTWIVIEWLRHGRASALGAVTGMVAGLGSITPASGYVGVAAAMAIGLTAGVLCYWITMYMKNVIHVDDALDVFSVHGVGGIVGTLLAGLFVATAYGGLGLADGMTIAGQLKVQLIAVVATIIWSGVGSFLLLKLVDMLVTQRVDEESEVQGLDLTQHEETGYNL
ncbi:MAG: ammonia channel protein [Gammaproteobacteria bacterium]|nr:MAG: ammonia channel protein [Gammaproteobacteria bacterium]